MHNPQAPSAAPRASVGATAPRAFALIFFLLSGVIPTLAEYAVYSAGTSLPYLGRGLAIVLISLTGFFALIAGLAGRAPATGKTFGALLALTYTGIAIFLQFGGIVDFNGFDNALLLGITYLTLFVSWACGRPFSGRGYFGLLVLVFVGVVGALVEFIPSIRSNYLGYLAIQDVVFAVSVWLTVGLSVAFEKTPSAAAQAQPPAMPTSDVNTPARLAFIFAMTAVGVELASLLAAFGGLHFLSVLSFAVPVLVILALVFGHRGRSQIRRTRQRGAGQAVAALIVGYAFIGLAVLGVGIQIAAIVAISNRYGG